MPNTAKSQFFSEAELSELYEAFSLCAKNGTASVDDLQLSLTDLQNGLQKSADPSLDLGTNIVSTVLSSIPQEYITFDELVMYLDTYMQQGDQLIPQSELFTIFQILSQNGKYITFSTLKSASTELGIAMSPQDLSQMLEFSDSDDRIHFQQFKTMLLANKQKHNSNI